MTAKKRAKAMSATSLSSAASASSTLTTSFAFKTLPPMFTCTDATIPWNYTGPTQLFSLFIWAVSASPPSSLSLVADSLDVTTGAYTWHPVNVTPGTYRMTAIGGDFSGLSQSFLVQPGSNTSCLSGAAGSAAVISPRQDGALLLSSRSSPDSEPISCTGAIIGGSVGGLALGFALLGSIIYFMLRRKAVPGYLWRRFSEPERGCTWTDLSSHVSVSVQEQPSRREAAALVGTKESGVAMVVPRLEPNRRKPSVGGVELKVLPSAPPTGPPRPAVPVSPLVRLDRELPLPPTTYVAPVDRLHHTRLRRSRTFDAADRTSVVWLHRTTPASDIVPVRRPSGTSAVPSTATSQMYRTRDSMWAFAPRSPDAPERSSVGTWGPVPSSRRTEEERLRRETRIHFIG
ncbi:hypothetical protein GY45DRAFT_1315204 [Cubamyces sp. BRFM 1775]|nr:hypothetical protein GY45DRAFT_1315204 [Cubamyces sp. BRFM 1775]